MAVNDVTEQPCRINARKSSLVLVSGAYLSQPISSTNWITPC